MDPNPKISRLRNLDEQALRETVLVPLLMRMGLKAVMIYHGPRERGKDIICFDLDRLGRREYMAVVAKVTDLDGSVSSSNSLMQVVLQIEQCFDVPYEDLFGMTRITMDRVWVVTSGRILSGAENSVYDHLSKRNLSKVVRFISGEHLVPLIDEHYPTYWHDSLEPVDVVREQKSRLVQFLRRLLVALGGSQPEVEVTINQLINSHFPPTVTIPPDKSLSRLSSYAVEIESIDSDYAHEFFTGECGSVQKGFFKAKEAIYYAMFDVDNSVYEYEKVIKTTNPKDLVAGFHDNLTGNYPFAYERYGASGDAKRAIEYLEYALEDIDELQENLRKVGKLEWAGALVDSVAQLNGDIGSFIDHLDQPEFTLYWKIEEPEGNPYLRLLYEGSPASADSTFATQHTREVDVSSWRQTRTRLITVNDVTQQAQAKIRDYLDGQLADMGIKPKVDD
jgi:tetratricopeptide (TPR) repeat protein